MNLLEALIEKIKFKKGKNLIAKRITKLNKDLELWKYNVGNLTNQQDDEFNYEYINNSLELESDCKFSIEIVRGKLNHLKPTNEKETKIKEDLSTTFTHSIDKFNLISSEFNKNELLIILKEEAAKIVF